MHKLGLYGLSPRVFAELETAQQGKCAICSGLPTSGQHLHIDHDHINGIVRGLLCRRCNSGLSMFRDNLDTLQNAVDYLTRNQRIAGRVIAHCPSDHPAQTLPTA